jgi:hypothetical protein
MGLTMNDLNQTLHDIAATGFNDPEHSEPDYLKAPPGPNDWDNIQPSDFGDWDYEITDLGNRQVFHPVSNAALQWSYKVFHKDIDRWQTGFVIETKFMDFVLYRARQDKLMSEDEYNEAMEENHRLTEQWEND